MTLRTLARQFFREEILGQTNSAQDAALFRAYAEQTTGRIVRAMGLAFAIAAFVWSSGDALLFPDDPHIQAIGTIWRIGNLLTLLPVILLLPRFPKLRDHPLPLAAACMALNCAWLTYNTGRIGPADAAWFGPIFPLPGISIMLLVPIVPRLLLTTLFAASAWAGYYALNPQRLAEEKLLGLVLSQQATTVVLAVGLGHLVYHYVRTSFLAQKALAEANTHLEARVREQRADLRRLADHIETVREDERVELARELHDELGQVLTALRFEFVLLESEARRQGANVSLREIDFYLERMRDAFRRILQRLRPRILDDFGLVAAAEWLVKDLGRETGLEISLSVPPADVDVRGLHRIIAFRALRESLNNTSRHASARSVFVELRVEGDALTLAVEDDGTGIGARENWPAESIGIIGTRERARTIGGDFVVERRPEGGTRATLRIPVSGTWGMA